jgi:transposase
MSLSLHKRYEIVFLHEHPAGPRWGYQKIASHIPCSKAAVAYWVKKYKLNKDLSDEEKTGRSRSTNAAQDERILRMAMNNHDITSGEIQQELEKRGITISSRTVRRRLSESGGKFSKEIPKPLLSEKHRAKRLEWAIEHQNFDWNRVIFTDESTFQLFRSNKKVWHFARKKKVFRTVKHSQKVHV